MSEMRNFYNNGQYEVGIAYAENSDNRSTFNEYDYLFYGNCLKKMGRYRDFLEMYKEFHSKFPNDKKLDDSMGWCLYYTTLQHFDFELGNKNNYIKTVDFIINHSSELQYSPRKCVITQASNAIARGQLGLNIDYELLNEYLSLLNPDDLPLGERQREVKGKTLRIASEREQWYSRKTKALEKLQKYDECLRYIDEAFSNIDHFHNNEKHWLNYRRALCLFALGNIDESEKIIKDILPVFTHWCFYESLFNISTARNDVASALKYGSICALSDNEHQLRVSFYASFAEYLLTIDKPYEAAMHFKLVEIIREENNWKTIRLPDSFSYPENLTEINKGALLSQLKKFWLEEKGRGVDYHEGVITKVLPDRKSGFIKDSDGSYYFNTRDFIKKVYDLKEGQEVRYTLSERLDKKKGEMKPCAVDISFI